MKKFPWFFFTVFTCLTGLSSSGLRPNESSSGPSSSPVAFVVKRIADTHQYRVGGHILGFTAEGVLIASGTHALKLEFVEAGRIQPVYQDRGSDKESASAVNEASPMTEIRYPGLWPGINLKYEGNSGGVVKSTYDLSAGADASAIKWRSNAPVEVDENGLLHYRFARGEMVESKPVAWQEIDGRRVEVGVDYQIRGEKEVGFLVDGYDRDYSLIIDPVLSWNTFLGGSGDDKVYHVAVDGSGNAYVTGGSNAAWGSPKRAYTSSDDAFVAKLDTDGNLIWNTFLGGSGSESGHGIAVDGSGNVYVTGWTNVTWGSPKRPYAYGEDAFAAKLDADGTLLWSTFLGGSGNDYGSGVALDGSGNAYVVGWGYDTWGSPVTPHSANYDAFAAKLDTNGNLTWNTFLGGSGEDCAFGNAVDGSGNVYVTGRSYATWGAPKRAYTAGIDAFAAKLDTNGSLAWNTFLGGSGEDQGVSLALDGSGNVYVAGWSYAAWGSPKRAYASGIDAFTAKLDTNGSLTWNTFLGAGGDDQGFFLAVDGSGSVYAAGSSTSTWGSPKRAYTASLDAFAAKLDTSGNFTWNTFLGGSGSDYGYGIAVDRTGNMYVSGYSSATWGSPKRAHTAGNDAFLAKIALIPIVTTAALSSISQTSATGGGNVTSDAGNTVTARGVCWSTSANPTIADSKTTDGSGTGAFSSSLTGLTSSTPYHVRAYATNSDGTGYGSDLTLTTLIQVQSLTVTSPNGGESWLGWWNRNITWTTTGTIANVKLEYTTDNGTSWTTITASTANANSYAWTVPNLSSANCRVRVSDAANPAVSDVSDAVFTIGVCGLISGTVTDLSGTPIQNIQARAYTADNVFWSWSRTNAAGQYWMGGLGSGSYKVVFLNDAAQNFLYEWYNDKRHFNAAESVAVTVGSTTENINAQLGPGGIISGRVTDENGTGLAGVTVSAWPGDGFLAYWSATTDANGDYQLKGLSAGNWKVMYELAGYPAKFFGGVYSGELATLIPVSLGAETSGKNIVLEKGGQISGRVTDGGGNPVSGIQVVPYDATSHGYLRLPGGTGLTAADGTYSILVRAGQAKVLFDASVKPASGLRSQFYSNKTAFDAAGSVTIAKEQTTSNIDAVLAAGGGTLTLTVTNSLGQGVPAGVFLYSAQYETRMKMVSNANAGGVLEIKGLLPGTYKLKVYDPNGDLGRYDKEWHENAQTFAAATAVTVTEGGNTAVAVVLNETSLAGTLTLTSPNGGESWAAGSNHNITWTSTGLAAGAAIAAASNIRIEYSTNGGTSYTTIVASTANTGAYAWTVPNAPSTTCLVRISEAAAGTPSDVSDVAFSIVVLPAVKIEGRVTESVPSPVLTRYLTGIKIEFSGGLGTVVTDAGGAFSKEVPYSWTGTVTPSDPNDPTAAFTPPSREYANIQSDQPGQDFRAVYQAVKLHASKSALNFGVSASGTKTVAQTILVTNAGGRGSVGFTTAGVFKPPSWISVNPLTGKTDSQIAIGVNPAGLAPGTYKGTVSIEYGALSAEWSAAGVQVTLTIASSSLAPFGEFSTPADGTTGITGAIPVTGWVVDDVEVVRVDIKRDPHPSDPAGAIGPDGLVFVGNGLFVEGARPDVEAAYPDYPMNYRAGWGYMLLTNFLPAQGNGTYKIHAFATDREGNQVLLGTKTIVCDNAHAAKPFGTIDTPAQGGNTSGSQYVNFGWVLTPLPKTIPKDGSTITVWVDGAQAGDLKTAPNVYDQYRVDVATAFPGLNNSNGPVGAFYLDTTKYAYGVHTIFWIATDNEGAADGIGSRYFNIAAPAQTLVSIAVTPANPTIAAGAMPRAAATQQFKATGTYADSSTADITTSVTWSSSNAGVATISQAGLASAVAAGSTTITAAADGISGNTTLTVTSTTLTSIAVTPANPSITLGTSQQFTATGAYSDGSTRDITASAVWNSSNAGVATVNAGGLAASLAIGSTTITAALGGITGSATLTVSAAAPIKLFNVGESPVISDILESSAGHILVAGSQSNQRSVYVLKLDAAANQVWNKYYPAGTYVSVCHIYEVSPDDYLVTGDIDATQGALFKMPLTGSGTASPSTQVDDRLSTVGWDTVRLPNGSIVYAGFTDIKDNGTTQIPYGDALLTGVNTAGTQYFRQNYNFAEGNSDVFYALIATSDGGFAAAGQTSLYDKGDGYGGPRNAILAKTGAAGNLLWFKNFGYISDNLGNDGAIDLVQLSDGGFAVLLRSGYGYKMYVIITDSGGNIKKAVNIDNYTGIRMITAADGGLVIAGRNAESRGVVVKLNSSGDKVWEYVSYFDSTDYTPQTIVRASDGTYLVAGSIHMGDEVYKTFVFKLDDAGRRVW